MSPTLVDTSAWFDFLRGRPEAVAAVDALLAADLAAITGPIAAELLSGCRTRPELARLRRRLEDLLWLAEPAEVWPRVAETRFTLARLGHQVGLLDVHIALAAADAGHALLTRDRDFERIATVVPVEVQFF